MKNIKAIIFDYDGTLSLRSHSAYNKYHDDLTYLFPNLNPNSIEFEALLQCCMTWDQYGTIKKSYVYEQLCEMTKLDSSIIAEMSARWTYNFDTFQILREGVEETLLELKKNYKLGCITNGDSFCQHNKLNATNLKQYFDSVVVSGDYGFHKPDPRIFEESFKQLNVKPEECIYIGDTFYADVYGAILAEATPIWIWSDHERPCATNIHRVTNFKQIPATIEHIKNQVD